MFPSSKDTKAVQKRNKQNTENFPLPDLGVQFITRQGDLSPGDAVVELAYDLVVSRTWLSPGHAVLEDAAAQEMNPGFSLPPHSTV